MLKKIIVGILFVSVIGAGGAAVAYQAVTPDVSPEVAAPVSESVQEEHIIERVAADSSISAPSGEAQPWEGFGIISSIDDYGFTLSTSTGESVYIELGPPDFWQAQGVALKPGQQVVVIGSISDGMIHAYQVQLADGQTLIVRNELGQPLWSGGVDTAEDTASTGGGSGSHASEPQASVDEWITITGTLVAYQRGTMTISTAEGELITFQTGQPKFFADQGVTFHVGEQIQVTGFYEGDQFMAGDILQLSTGLRVWLRDPNGRPLWAGPGGNGNGGGGGGGGGYGKGGE